MDFCRIMKRVLEPNEELEQILISCKRRGDNPRAISDIHAEYHSCLKRIRAAQEVVQHAVEWVCRPSYDPEAQSKPDIHSATTNLCAETECLEALKDRFIHIAWNILNFCMCSNFYIITFQLHGISCTFSKKIEHVDTHGKVTYLHTRLYGAAIELSWVFTDQSDTKTDYFMSLHRSRWYEFWPRFITTETQRRIQQIKIHILQYLPQTLSFTVVSYIDYSCIDMLNFLHNYIGSSCLKDAPLLDVREALVNAVLN